MGSILVTGAYGLVGHEVHRQLAAAGHEVVGIDLTDAAEPGFPVVPADVRDTHRLHAMALRHAPIDAIIHCGAFSGPMLARDNPALLIDVNLGGTANLLELARVHHIPRFVFCSSVSAVGPTPPGLDPVGEDVPLRPSTVYGATKAAGEALVQGYQTQHGVRGTCIRIGWVYGPRRQTTCDLRDMILAGLDGRPWRRDRGADALRQYVHVRDVARALVMATAAADVPQAAYMVTDGQPRRLDSIAAMISAGLPGLEVVLGPGLDPEEDRQAPFDLSAAARDLGFQPGITLQDGIADYRSWLAARRGERG